MLELRLSCFYNEAVETLSDWSGFLDSQTTQRPLAFIAGMRHVVGKGPSCGFHSHPAIEIVYHPVGAGVTRVENGQAIHFQEGSAVVYAPHVRHDQSMTRPGEDLCVQVACPSGRFSRPRDCLYLPQVESHAVIEDIRTLSHGYTGASRLEQTIFNLRATATLLALVNSACISWRSRTATQAERHVEKAEQFIREHLVEIKSLDDVAEAVGISHDHLRHVFRQQRGKSLIRHLNEARIERAKSLLAHSRLPMKQIASLCGFGDEYYFSSTFRKFTRAAPSHYRRDHS